MSGTGRGAPPAAVLAPLSVRRDLEGYQRWWEQLPERSAITETLGSLADDAEVEWSLNSLMLMVFQGDHGPVDWLRVDGLAAGVQVVWLGVDLDPSYDGQGVLDGVDVVLNLQVLVPEARQCWISSSVYVSRPARVFAPEAAEVGEALGEIIDEVLKLANQDLAERDTFNTEARAVIAPGEDTAASQGAAVEPLVAVCGFVSDLDGAQVVQIDTTEGAGRVRVMVNDGPVYDGDPETDEPPGAHYQGGGWQDGRRLFSVRSLMTGETSTFRAVNESDATAQYLDVVASNLLVWPDTGADGEPGAQQ